MGEPDRTAGSPTTPTGRLLLDWFQSDAMPLDDYVPDGDFLAAILATEAEARAPLEVERDAWKEEARRYAVDADYWNDEVARLRAEVARLKHTAALAPAAPEPAPAPAVERCARCDKPFEHRNHEPIDGAYPRQWVVTCHQPEPAP